MFARRDPGRLNRRNIDTVTVPAGFTGNIASLFPGAYQVLQSDRGLIYGSTMLAQGTAPPVITLSGSILGSPVPIRIEATSAGSPWAGRISYDGGVTFPQTFTSIVSSVALAGAPGLTANIAGGAASLNNVWRATCAQLQDQSGNGKHAVQAVAASQPVIGVGLNGKVSLIFDGNDDWMATTALAPPIGSLLYCTFRWITGTSGFPYLTDGEYGIGSNRYAVLQWSTDAGDVSMFSGGRVSGGVLPVGSYGRVAALFNGAASSIKVGAFAPVIGDVGIASALGGRTIGVRADVTAGPANIELLNLVWVPNMPYDQADAALNSPGGYGPGSIITGG